MGYGLAHAGRVKEILNRAADLFRAQDFAACLSLCRSVLADDPADIGALHLTGVSQVRGGDPRQGVGLLERALSVWPRELLLRMDCALGFAGLGAIDRAVAILAEGARYHPGNPDLAARLARLLSDHGRHSDSQAVLRAALAARPDHLELRGLLAAELAADLAFSEAGQQMRLMQTWFPEQSPLYANEGVLRQSQCDLAGAMTAYRRAVAIDPENHVAQVNFATALMSQGDYAAGWIRYEHRLHLRDMRLPPAGIPRWQGESLEGKRLLVSAEQGFGDLLQFARFLPLLQGEIWLDCPVEMKRLMASLPGIKGVLSPGDEVPRMDYAIPLLSLPCLLQTGGKLMSETIPYIYRPRSGPALPADPRRKIGLVWSGRPAKGELFIRRTLARRSCLLSDLEPLWRLPQFAWYSLQLGERVEPPLIDLAPLISDFADSAALIDQLDLVISIDTAAAHLTAAMGKPLWLLLAPGQCDYRWTQNCPWYPGIRMFQCPFNKMATEVARTLVEWGPAPTPSGSSLRSSGR
jgi:tetratricopeptide (TPR) repeat protein